MSDSLLFLELVMLSSPGTGQPWKEVCGLAGGIKLNFTTCLTFLLTQSALQEEEASQEANAMARPGWALL